MLRIATPLRALGLAVIGLGISLSLIFSSSPPVEAHVSAPQAVPMPMVGSSDGWWVSCNGTSRVDEWYLLRKDHMTTDSVSTAAMSEVHRVNGTKGHYRVLVDTRTKKKYKIRLRTYSVDGRGVVKKWADQTIKDNRTECLKGFAPKGGFMKVIAEVWIKKTIKRNGKKKTVTYKYKRSFNVKPKK